MAGGSWFAGVPGKRSLMSQSDRNNGRNTGQFEPGNPGKPRGARHGREDHRDAERLRESRHPFRRYGQAGGCRPASIATGWDGLGLGNPRSRSRV